MMDILTNEEMLQLKFQKKVGGLNGQFEKVFYTPLKMITQLFNSNEDLFDMKVKNRTILVAASLGQLTSKPEQAGV